MKKRKTLMAFPQKHKAQEVDDYDDDQEDEDMSLKLQELLYEWLSSNKTSESESDFLQDDFKKTPDMKKKAIDKSYSMEGIDGLSFSSRQFEKGESSSTFCVICDDAKPATAMERNNKCGHSFCEDCIKNYVGEKIQEDVMQIKCPETNCKRVLDNKLCQSLIPEDLIDYLHISCCEVRALSWPRVLQCPHHFCSGLFLDDRRKFPIIACPHCWRLICVDCWVPYHEGMNCREYQQCLRVSQLSSARPVYIIFFE